MSPTMKALGIDRLSIDERGALVQEIWDSIAEESPEQGPLTEDQKRGLDRRPEAHRANTGDVVPWEVIKAEARARLRR